MSAGPSYGYVAYIDEAGDDGLRAVKPISNPGSSEWLVLSAVVLVIAAHVLVLFGIIQLSAPSLTMRAGRSVLGL